MLSPKNTAVVLTDTSFSWPDGTSVLTHVTGAFGVGRTGLIGSNGVGKTTLLRLIAGALQPSAGNITTTGAVGYLPQDVSFQTNDSVADLLGIRSELAALRAIEAGATDPVHFDTVGDDWDVEGRSRAVLAEIGLGNISLDRPLGTLSGGEVMLTALAGLRIADTPIVLLDEPTNNLDRQARERLYDTITDWAQTLIVVSHDVQLLELMDETAELRDAILTVYGGPFSAYRAYIDQEQAAAEQALRTAEQVLRTERRQRIEAETKLARRRRYAQTDFENRRRPKIVMKQRATEAQVSAGKLRGEMTDKVDDAQQAVRDSTERVRDDSLIRISLPDPELPAGRQLAELSDRHHTLYLQGRERLALVGANGIGKTRLLEQLVFGDTEPSCRQATAIRQTDRIGYLPQRLDHLDETASILDVVRHAAPTVVPGVLRAQLARFLFRGDTIHQVVETLSGGERFRVALACLLLADPPNQLLILDEPTNNLDLATVEILVEALDAYRGGLIVVSHDDEFLSRLHIDTRLTLNHDGLSRSTPPGTNVEEQ